MHFTVPTSNRPTGRRSELARTGKDEWKPVSKAEPCLVCGKDHNCKRSVSDERLAVYCSRVQSDRQNAGGQWLHFLNGSDHRPTARPDAPTPVKIQRMPWSPFKPLAKLPSLEYYVAKAAEPQHVQYLDRWCELWGTPKHVLISLGAIAYPTKIILPEVDPNEPTSVVTLVSRMISGAKRWLAAKGRRRGTVSSGIPKGKSHLTILVEGGSCAAAAKSAGAEPVSRSTRDLDLSGFAPYLEKSPAHHPILALVENDTVKPSLTCSNDDWMHHLITEAKGRAESLATELGRPVLVNTPPVEWNGLPINDFADLWRAAVNGRGHLMSEEERHEIGGELCRELIETAEEVLPSAESMMKYRKTFILDQEERILAKAESDRQHSIELGSGCDSDYDRYDSCVFYKSFTRPNKEQAATDLLFGALACKSWRCPPCKRRKLLPDWSIHISSMVVLCDTIFRKTVNGRNEAELRRKLGSIRKQVGRSKGQYCAIHKTETEAVIFSTVPMKRPCNVFSCRTHREDFNWMMRWLCLDVYEIELQSGKPITTSRDWSRGEKVELKHVAFKITRIAELAEENNRKLFVTEMTMAEAADRLTAILKNNSTIKNLDERCDFMAFKLPDEAGVVVLSSLTIQGATEHAPGDAAKIARRNLWIVSGKSGEDWRGAIQASPRWQPKATKEWRPLGIECSPTVAADTAIKIGASPKEISYGPTDAFTQGVAIRFYNANTQQMEDFISLLNSENTGET